MSKRQLHQIEDEDEEDVLYDGIDVPEDISEIVEHNETDLFKNLIEDFQDMMSDKQVLKHCIEGFIDNVVNEFTLGIIFDIHRKHKTNAYCLELDDSGDEDEPNETDGLKQINLKKNRYCVCPKCDRAVAGARFVTHLESCMGMGRVASRIGRASRNASRRVNTNKGDTSSYAGIPSDDDDDADWNSSERKRNKKKDKNGGKKNRNTAKKNLEPEPVELLNVDIEGEDDELTSLQDVLHLQDVRSNSASPAEGAAMPRKREKKKKNRTKDRSSPSTMSMD